MAASAYITALRWGRKRIPWQEGDRQRINPESIPARLLSSELPDGKGYLYKYHGQESDVQVAVCLGFRHYSNKIATTPDPHIAAKLVAHADKITTSRIIAGVMEKKA